MEIYLTRGKAKCFVSSCGVAADNMRTSQASSMIVFASALVLTFCVALSPWQHCWIQTMTARTEGDENALGAKGSLVPRGNLAQRDLIALPPARSRFLELVHAGAIPWLQLGQRQRLDHWMIRTLSQCAM